MPSYQRNPIKQATMNTITREVTWRSNWNQTKLTSYKKSPLYRGMLLWDMLDHSVQRLEKTSIFKGKAAKTDFALPPETP